MASMQQPQNLTPWYDQPRGFSFQREVQPVLDKYCVGCHTAEKAVDGRPVFSHDKDSYSALHPYVRRNGPEGDYHLLTPLEFHADTSELVQLLQKGHYNVTPDAEAWDRLVTWINLNVPKHGSWSEISKKSEVPGFLERRADLQKLFANVDVNPEAILNPYKPAEFERPAKLPQPPAPPALVGWPIDPAKAAKMQDGKKPFSIDLGNGQKMNFVYIPAGQYVMGSETEQPMKKVEINRPFWMGTTEVSLAQYRQFKPGYDNGVYDMHYKDQVDRGYYVNEPDFPVIRVPFTDAEEFCKWLAGKTGKNVTLPTEEQWEWACRAGTDSLLWFGDKDTDFSAFANLADVSIRKLAVKGVNPKPIPNPSPEYDYELKDERFNDGVLHLAEVGKYQPNAWGLYDMHGNVCEWTRSDYDESRKVVRGGSWKDRQERAASAFRIGYPPWQQVYNTGFRVIIEE